MADYRIIKKSIEDIRPYAKNPRLNDQAVNAVMESILSFGFKQPIVIDENNVIIAGHTRYLASKKLNLKEVPVIVADDLSKKQVKAYRLADNRVGELAKWDESKLIEELKDINSFDMGLFGFDETLDLLDKTSKDTIETGLGDENNDNVSDNERPETKEQQEIINNEAYYGDERERTFNAYNLYDYDKDNVSGKYDMPIIQKTDHKCNEFIGFNYALTSKEKNKGVHFFIDDYQFERIWAQPEKYMETLATYDCVLTPDFSLYLDMPTAMKIWNTYRSRLIGQKLQKSGIVVIPTISWAEEKSFDYCFDGIEGGGTIAVSTIGVKNNEEQGIIWAKGMQEAINRLHPECILLYGGMIDFDFKNIEVIEIKNDVNERWRRAKYD